MITLSRNCPVGLVVGAAGFLGSHLSERLVQKGIQVVGVDDLSSGSDNNLQKITGGKNFHFIHQSIVEKFPLGFPRLDYVFFIVSENLPPSEYAKGFENFLAIIKNFQPKIVLVSTINLYDNQRTDLQGLKEAERILARFALENKFNARVVRLAAVFGPRMHFREDDPIVRLIYSEISGNLKNDLTPLDFTTRGIFVDDAVDLLIKAVFHGATAQKIYDGAMHSPVKVSEIRQILLDPVWHENRGFVPTELPPWPTPNLYKTEKELSWATKTSLVAALRQTIKYFKDNPGELKVVKNQPERQEPQREEEKVVPKDKYEQIKEYVRESKGEVDGEKIIPKKEEKKSGGQIGGGFKKGMSIFVVLALVFYALIFPLVSLFYDGYALKANLQNSATATGEGNFDEALKSANLAKQESERIAQFVSSWRFLGSLGPVYPYFRAVENLSEVLTQISQSSVHAVKGAKDLSLGLKSISGEEEGDPKNFFDSAEMELGGASKELDFTQGKISQLKSSGLFQLFNVQMESLNTKVTAYNQMIDKGRSLGFALSQMAASADSKKLLVLLLDNTQIRPGGGVIASYAVVEFNKGRLANINSGATSELNSLKGFLAAPTEVKNDLGKNEWYFQDIANDPDFPTNARLAQWFFNQKTESRVDGVIMVDLWAVKELLAIVGPVYIPELKNSVNDQNLLSQASLATDEKFSAAILKEVINRSLLVPQKNWLESFEWLEQSLSEKHLFVYDSNPTVFAYLHSQGWAGFLPKVAIERVGERNQFLAWSESNIGGTKVNNLVERAFDLESRIGKDGGVSHNLVVEYKNNSNTQSLLAGRYKFRIKAYLAAGSKLTKVSWADRDITKDVNAFSDFGRAGYSLTLDLKPGEQKRLILQYQDLNDIKFDNNKVVYKLDVVKQFGTQGDKFNFKLIYPSTMQLVGDLNSNDKREVAYSAQMVTDESFLVSLQKN